MIKNELQQADDYFEQDGSFFDDSHSPPPLPQKSKKGKNTLKESK